MNQVIYHTRIIHRKVVDFIQLTYNIFQLCNFYGIELVHIKKERRSSSLAIASMDPTK